MSQRMRRICIFCESWESGGIESFLKNVLLNLKTDGLEIDIVAAELRKSVFTRELQDAGVRFVELSGSLHNLLKNHRMFRRLLDERRYDVLHLNAYQGMTLCYARLAQRAGVPVRIAHSHNTALRGSALRPVKLALHDVYRRRYTRCATELWACSKAAAEFLFPSGELDRRGWRFIPNGIDTERFRFQPEIREQVRRELGVGGNFVVGNIGRLCYQKNQGFLLDVLAELLKSRPESILLLVGDGEDRASLEEKAKRLGIEAQVIFYGTSTQVERLLWAMDVFAFPSRFEGLGIAALEAQAAGLPVVCSEHVPEEARVTERVYSLPLDPTAARWSRAIERIPQNTARDAEADRLKQAGFHVREVSQSIGEKYRGENAER